VLHLPDLWHGFLDWFPPGTRLPEAIVHFSAAVFVSGGSQLAEALLQGTEGYLPLLYPPLQARTATRAAVS
jgi:hypothetical protein